jgi:hypothetical protein
MQRMLLTTGNRRSAPKQRMRNLYWKYLKKKAEMILMKTNLFNVSGTVVQKAE